MPLMYRPEEERPGEDYDMDIEFSTWGYRRDEEEREEEVDENE